MAKPTQIEFHEDPGHTIEFEENSEVKAGKKKKLTVRVTSGDNNQHRTGVLIRHFTGDPPDQARRATARIRDAGPNELLLLDLHVAVHGSWREDERFLGELDWPLS